MMFCDLMGSTPLAEKLDPEELREVILAYQEVCAEVIRRFEGYWHGISATDCWCILAILKRMKTMRSAPYGRD